MPKPSEYAVHFFISGGQKEEVRFPSIEAFQKWYGSELKPKAQSDDFINVPLKKIEGEYMVIRPSAVLAMRLEPIYTSSVDRF
jgi:hypothetical protein